MRHTIALPRYRHGWTRDSIVGLGVAGGMAVALVGVVVFLGWVLDVTALKTVAPGLASMKANTALGFLFGGLAIAVAGVAPAQHGLRLALAAVPLVLGVATLLQYALGADLGIDQLLFADPASKLWPGRMSLATALNMVLLGLGAMAVLAQSTPLRWAGEFIKLAGTLHALLALVGYLYNVSSFYAVTPYSSVALHTAMAFFVAFAALYCVRPMVGVAGLVTADNAGGVLARRLLVSAVMAPVVIGLIVVRGVQAHSYNIDFALAVFTIANTLVLAAVVLHTAYEIGRVDDVRIRAIDELREANEIVHLALADKQTLLTELQRNEERFRTIADAAPMPIVITRPDEGYFLYVNEMAERTFGYSRDTFERMHASRLYMNPADREVVLDLCRRHHRIVGHEVQMRRADGTPLMVAMNAAETHILDEPALVVSFVDLTDRDTRRERGLLERSPV